MLINPDSATLDEMNLFLAERLEGLRREHNQRIPEHVAGLADCSCEPSCGTEFGRDWQAAEPHIETLVEAMCQAGNWYMTAVPPKPRQPGYYWHFATWDALYSTENKEVGFDAISPLLAAYRAAVRTVLKAGVEPS